ncbi:PREDICTED: alcohol dehydrogenase [NADP(+)]-like [Branchiostoma belcheri]|uniref:alcohol dehydrogenase (NADP(+)) n=1 Tax=Branchiostoma belcheri TaxID=7741 RepID=A0A6P4YWS3_BRABE|nr:PREDICTED: alcohol dehydrogenase [NADP(+)]-like [Branchiostoma belcheri]
MAAAGPTAVLSSGKTMPLLGLGTWQSKPEEVFNAVKVAIDAGYRHIDTAWAYRNEKEVGQAIKEKIAEGKIKREDVFVTTKLFTSFSRPEHVRECMMQSLSDLGLDYVDLYLIHSPLCFKYGTNPFQHAGKLEEIFDDVDYVETWKAMESLADEGLAKSIGVSNFNSQQLERLLQNCRIKPAVNQVELHPYLAQQELVDFCKRNNILITAYSSLGAPGRPKSFQSGEEEPVLMEDPSVLAIANKYGKSAAQVLLRYHLDRGVSAIAKSVTPSRIQANIDIMDFSLSKEDLVSLGQLDRKLRYVGANLIKMAATVPLAALSSGHKMPLLGLGTSESTSEQGINAVKTAIDAGYRHIDTAWMYKNEKEVGQAIKEKIAEGKIKREDVFVTTKLFITFNRPEHVREAMMQSLGNLGLDYVDLYLIHSPMAFKYGSNVFQPTSNPEDIFDDVDYVDTWKAMESLADEGLAKSIGVSNFNIQQLERLLQNCRIKPAVNQVELHPYLAEQDLLDFCKGNGVLLTAYSPLGAPARYGKREADPVLMEDPSVVAIATKYGKSAAQVLIRYHLDRGVSVIPKSVTPSRIQANFDIMDFSLSQEDLAILGGLDRNLRYLGGHHFTTHKYFPY